MNLQEVANNKYLAYMNCHKQLVVLIGIYLGGDYKVLKIHDDSRYSHQEFTHYANFLFGTTDVAAYEKAVEHHLKYNPHHWEYWVKNGVAHPMPKEYITEMVSDWIANNITIGLNMSDTFYTMHCHPDTRNKARVLLHNYGYGDRFLFSPPDTERYLTLHADIQSVTKNLNTIPIKEAGKIC